MITRPESIRTPKHAPTGTLLLAVAAAAALAACGGGDDSASSGENASMEVAQSTSATATVVPDDASAATAEVVNTAQLLAAAAGQASLTINCAGGGTAVYAVTGNGLSLPTLTNGQFDAGERYSLTLDACKGATGAASVTGSYTLDVVSASASGFVVNTATNNVVVTLPRSTVTVTGSSNWTQSSTTVGANTTTTTRWTTTTDHVVKVLRNARERTHTLSNVDLTRGITTINGALDHSTLAGHATLTSTWPNGSYSVTFNVDNTVTYDASGKPTQGAWRITLPNNAIGFQIVGNNATVTVDYGANGSIDRTYTWPVLELVAAGG